jgi:hypothetical protein
MWEHAMTPDDNGEPADEVPRRIESTDAYVDLGDIGQVIPTGHEQTRSEVRDDALQTERVVQRILHCCQHFGTSGIGDPHARCCVSNLTICPRPECSIRCWKCQHYVCPIHKAIVDGLPYCANCLSKGDSSWMFFLILVVFLLFILASL